MAEKQIKLADLVKGTDYKEIPKEVKQHSDILLAKGKKIVL